DDAAGDRSPAWKRVTTFQGSSAATDSALRFHRSPGADCRMEKEVGATGKARRRRQTRQRRQGGKQMTANLVSATGTNQFGDARIIRSIAHALLCWGLVATLTSPTVAEDLYVNAAAAPNGDGSADKPYWRITDGIERA